jgi:hypothetical protein
MDIKYGFNNYKMALTTLTIEIRNSKDVLHDFNVFFHIHYETIKKKKKKRDYI